MAANTDLSARVEGMLSSERTRRKPWYARKRADLPTWFVNVPDGLDIEQKRALFDKTATDVNRAVAVGVIAFAGTLQAATLALVSHHWNAAALSLLLAFGACAACIPLLRRKLVDRQLRRHSQP